jgi:hypothetical protein
MNTILLKINELFKVIILILFLVLLFIFYMYSQNGRYIQYKWGASNYNMILDTRTGTLYKTFYEEGKPTEKFWAKVIPPIEN